jgi:hypothetical protein
MAGVERWMCAVALLMLLAGCGYSQSSQDDTSYKWSSVYRTDVRTIAVPIFTSKDFSRGIEFSISKALVSQIEANTPYKVAPCERADTILEGEIVEVRAGTLSEDRRAAIPQEQLLNIVINFTWKDLRTGKILVSRRSWEQAATWYPTLGEGRFEASQAAAEKLAIAIVHELQSDW